MSTSTLDPDNDLTLDRKLGTGHDDSALGPSDSSDNGSDVKGLFGGDSDTDRQGTGERSTVEMPDESEARQDIGVDHIESVPDLDIRNTGTDVERGDEANRKTSEINEAPEDVEFEDETR
jgi:hypothetical protein